MAWTWPAWRTKDHAWQGLAKDMNQVITGQNKGSEVYSKDKAYLLESLKQGSGRFCSYHSPYWHRMSYRGKNRHEMDRGW